MTMLSSILVASVLLGFAAALLGIRLGVRAPVDRPIGADE
jgi:hypothetical protein